MKRDVPSFAASDIDPYSVQIFREVADSGSFTRAAERVGLSQSAVTRQIQALEEAVDLKHGSTGGSDRRR